MCNFLDGSLCYILNWVLLYIMSFIKVLDFKPGCPKINFVSVKRLSVKVKNNVVSINWHNHSSVTMWIGRPVFWWRLTHPFCHMPDFQNCSANQNNRWIGKVNAKDFNLYGSKSYIMCGWRGWEGVSFSIWIQFISSNMQYYHQGGGGPVSESHCV